MYANINGLKMFYEDRSSSDPTGAIVFLHGFISNHSMWRNQLDFFSIRYRCIAPDLRGYGGTTVLDQSAALVPYAIDTLADDVIALLDHLGVKRANFCGLSMGGYIALAIWRRYRKRVKQMLLVDTRALGDTSDTKANRARQIELVKTQGVRALAEEMLPKQIAPQNIPRLGKEVRFMIESCKPETVIATLTALPTRKDMGEWLRRVQVPTLIAVGEHDVIATKEDAQFMKEQIDDAELVVIPDAGHLSPLENPKAFNEAAYRFLRS